MVRRRIAEALAIAEVEPETVTYIEAHGTGTLWEIPLRLLHLQAFRASTQKQGFIGSVKTNVGHLITAAGVAGLIKTVLALKHKSLPPSLHFSQPNPKIDFANSPFYVNTTLSEWKNGRTPRRAGVSSFGIGSTNAHVVLEEPHCRDLWRTQLSCWCYPPNQLCTRCRDGESSGALKAASINLADVAYTYQVGRRTFNHRRILVCETIDDAAIALETLAPQRVRTFHSDRAPCHVFRASAVREYGFGTIRG